MFSESNAYEHINRSEASVDLVPLGSEYTRGMMDPGAQVQLSPWLLPAVGR